MMINCKSENCSCVLTDIYTEGKGWIRVCPVCNYAESNPSFHRKPTQFDIQAADAYVKAQRRGYAKAEELFRDASQSTDDEGLKTSYLLWAVKCFFGVEYVRETLYEHDDTLRHYQYTPVFARFPFNGSSIEDSLTLRLFSSYLQQHPHLGLSTLYSELVSTYRETGDVLRKKEFQYDVFIAWHDRDGSDRCKEFARELSSWLSKKRIYTFTSFDAMEHIPVDHFEPYIYAALATARVFVLVVDDYDSLGNKFLRYEVIRMAIRKTNDPRIRIIFNGMHGHVGHVPPGLMDGWQRHYEDSECTPDRIALVGRDVKEALSSYNKSTAIQPNKNEQRTESLSHESKETGITEIAEDTTFAITVLPDNRTPSDEQNAVNQNCEDEENQIKPSESNMFEGFEYIILEDGNVEIAGCNVNTPQITIPRTIEGRTVTRIGNGIFAKYRDQEILFYSVIIPDSVIEIGNNAFKDSLLTKISIPNSVSIIGESAFEHCILLKSVDLPEGVTCLKDRTFDRCAKLETIVIPDSVTEIGADAFAECESLRVIGLPNSITTIKSGAFYKCTSLESISIPDRIEYIGACVFEECINLKSVSLSKKWTIVPHGFFVGCTSLSSITLPDCLEAIEDIAFENCQSLEEIIIPEGTLSIGKAAFSGCKNLRHIYIPDSVTNIEDDAFSNCNKKLTLLGKETAYSKSFAKKHKLKYVISNSNIINEKKTFSIWVAILAILLICIICYFTISNFNIEKITEEGNVQNNASQIVTQPPSELKRKWPDAENESTSLSKIDDQKVSENSAELLSEGEVCANIFWQFYSDGSLHILGQGDMPSFDWYADADSSRPPWREYSNQISNIIINEGITTIGDQAFINCNNLTSIAIPNGITAIGIKAFSGCEKLDSIVIPSSITSIGDNAFYNCAKLTSVDIPDGVFFIGDAAFDCCSRLTSVSIPDSVTTIGKNPFRRCNNLTVIDVSSDHPALEVVDGVLFSKPDKRLVTYFCSSADSTYSIPQGTEVIGDCAFWDCDNLHFIAIPDSVNSICEEAFRGCGGLTAITIPDNISTISSFMFSGCSSLTNFTIPDNVTSIGYSAFSNCTSLASIDIPDSVVSIDHYVFENCTGLLSITIPDSVTSIGSCAFDNCSNLASITIPNTVAEIDNRTFRGCSSLTSIRIPVSVTSIDWNAFEGCSSLTDVYYEGNEKEWSDISIDHDNDALVSATVHFNTVDHWDFYKASDSEIADAMFNFWSGWDEATGARCTFFVDNEKKRGGYYWQCKQGTRVKGNFAVGEIIYGENDTDISVVTADGVEYHLSVVPYEDGSIEINLTSVSDIVSGSVRLYLDNTELKETIRSVILRYRDAHNELNGTLNNNIT